MGLAWAKPGKVGFRMEMSQWEGNPVHHSVPGGGSTCSLRNPPLMCCKESVSCSVVSDSLGPPPWTVAHRAPLSMGFSRQEFWSGLPFPSPGIFLTQELNTGLLYCREILHHLSPYQAWFYWMWPMDTSEAVLFGRTSSHSEWAWTLLLPSSHPPFMVPLSSATVWRLPYCSLKPWLKSPLPETTRSRVLFLPPAFCFPHSGSLGLSTPWVRIQALL